MERSLFFRLMKKPEGMPTHMKVHDTFGKSLEYKVHGGSKKEEKAFHQSNI